MPVPHRIRPFLIGTAAVIAAITLAGCGGAKAPEEQAEAPTAEQTAAEYRQSMVGAFAEADTAGQAANTPGTRGWSDRGIAFSGLVRTMERMESPAEFQAAHDRIIAGVELLAEAGQAQEELCRPLLSSATDCLAAGMRYFEQIRGVRAQIEAL